MAESSNIWYRIGFALESARQDPPARRLRGLAERDDGQYPTYEADDQAASKHERPPRRRQSAAVEQASPREQAIGALMTAGAGALASKLLGLVPARRKPGMFGLLRAGAAGAGAALLCELLDPMLRGEARLAALGPRSSDTLLAGAARGLLYAALLEPRLPGPPAVQGILYGSVEYAVSPWGGLTQVLGESAPHRRLPFLGGLFDAPQAGEEGYLEHLLFGVALALFYGAGSPSSNGILEDE
jgi:hypothetical protein